ncbi:NAD-dependent epimerase/dehydratase family protein [Amycolatopsis sp. NPDC048633]|uniref:NAD-dependent epimerase/dehydratase family protein n=1 Tax=Amycolatopsis sp. NPDC048633 TaxID=3157095 RepID=UPI0033C2241A
MTAGEPDILVTGATGFVGTAVLRELVGRGMGPRVRILVRRPPPAWMTDAGVTPWPGDLRDAAGLAGACTGITTLVHLASQVGGDPELCTEVNEAGTARLLAEAGRAGTAHVLYLSTCAVYRDGVHQGAVVPGSLWRGSPAGGGLSGSEADPGAPTGLAGSRSGAGLVADLGLPTSRGGPAGARQGSNSGPAVEQGPQIGWSGPASGGLLGGLAGARQGSNSGPAAEQGPPTGRNSPAGGGLPESVADQGPQTGWSGPAGGGLRGGHGLVADLGPPTSRNGSAGRSGPGLAADGRSPVSRDGLAGSRPGAESGLAAEQGAPVSRGGPVGEGAPEPVAGQGPPTGRNAPVGVGVPKPVAAQGPSTGSGGPVDGGAPEQGPPTDRSGPAGEHLHTGSDLVTDPASPTSRSRLAGERLVLAAGGTVLRPHLVHGVGDRHLVPALVRWVQAVPAWAAGGAARTSLVAVADLAAAIAVLAVNPRLTGAGEVLHVADPRPVRMRRLVTAVCELLDLPVPVTDLPLAEHRARTRAALPSLTDHQYSLLTRDHWYDSDRIWDLTGVSPGPGFGPSLTGAADWYRESLGIRLP